MLDGVTIRVKDHVRSLEVFLDLALLLDEQVAAVTRALAATLFGKEITDHHSSCSRHVKTWLL